MQLLFCSVFGFLNCVRSWLTYYLVSSLQRPDITPCGLKVAFHILTVITQDGKVAHMCRKLWIPHPQFFCMASAAAAIFDTLTHSHYLETQTNKSSICACLAPSQLMSWHLLQRVPSKWEQTLLPRLSKAHRLWGERVFEPYHVQFGSQIILVHFHHMFVFAALFEFQETLIFMLAQMGKQIKKWI